MATGEQIEQAITELRSSGRTRIRFWDLQTQYNITASDLNGKGRIDFADIVALFNEI
jgi:hypothetical protein